MTANTDMRAAFEADLAIRKKRPDLSRDSMGRYKNPVVHEMFATWQAATIAAAEAYTPL